jgi:hypothetical protein
MATSLGMPLLEKKGEMTGSSIGTPGSKQLRTKVSQVYVCGERAEGGGDGREGGRDGVGAAGERGCLTRV